MLFVGVFFGAVASAENLANSSDIKTEKITCVFNNSQKQENCFNYFIYGNIEIPKDEETGAILQYQCEGVGECSITVKGENGSKMKWDSICNERRPASNNIDISGKRNTIIDGTDKIIEFNCKRPSLLENFFSLFASGYDLLQAQGLYAFYKDRIGQRDLYYLCYDGAEEVQNNDAPVCTSDSEWGKIVNEICNNHCSKDGNCGVSQFGTSEMCLTDKTSENFEGNLRN